MKHAPSGQSNPGYLVWTKIPFTCLLDKRLADALEKDLSGQSDPALRAIHAAKSAVEETIRGLALRGITSIRTGISWAEWETARGPIWIEWYMRRFADHFSILPNLTFTPPDIAVEPRTNAPPRDLASYARFVHDVLCHIDDIVEDVELWNEWNLDTDWDPKLDKDFKAFKPMMLMGALAARHHGKRVVFGGASGHSFQVLHQVITFAREGIMQYFDVVGLHNLRGTWSNKVPSLPLSVQASNMRDAASAAPDPESIDALADQIRNHAADDPDLMDLLLGELANCRIGDASCWITEYGFPTDPAGTELPTWLLEDIQAALFAYSVQSLRQGEVERVYWYTLKDLRSPSLRHATTGWEDILQYTFGDTREDGRPKLLGRLLLEGGPDRVLAYAERKNLLHLVDKASLDRKMPGE